MRRLIVLAVLLGAGLALGSLGSVAWADEALEEYLQDAADADYSGSEIVVSYWEEEAIAAIFDVQQSGGMTRVDGGDGEAMAGEGMFEGSTEEGASHTIVSDWADWRIHERYSLDVPRSTARLGRPATIVTILEDGDMRMRLIIDDATGAALRTEVFAGSGELYRISVLLDFQPNPAPMTMDFQPASKKTVSGADAPSTLPTTVFGYRLADTYEVPGAAVHAFYTDGLFSFSVFEYDGHAEAGPFADAGRWKVGGSSYRRVSDPGAIRLFWTTGDATYVLMGDLPPDHLELVLAELPRPAHRTLISRVWRGLFG